MNQQPLSNEILESLLLRVNKPARYIGGELHSVVKNRTDCRFGFAFPDTYDIGMSFMGMQILYDILNKDSNVACERVFAPANDMEKIMREENVPLFTLETKTPLAQLDILGFTLQYELSYSNILNMLELSQIPFLAKERDEEYPLLIGGGPCAFNPEPLAVFFDAFLVGDGEDAILQICHAYIENKKRGTPKKELLQKIASIDGVYVPSFYEPHYNEDGTLKEYQILEKGVSIPVKKRVAQNLDTCSYPLNPLVPLTETVHERAVIETFRGCTRGCRFCQAGMIYRPVRERKQDTILHLAKEQLKSTGHEELSLLSLSTSDHSCFEPLVTDLIEYCEENHISLSLPSLRLDNFSFQILGKIQKARKTGLTFAPEAGTQRLRNVINKGITEEDIMCSIEKAIRMGWNHVKLYFMIGLPTETFEDLEGIIHLTKRILSANRDIRGPKGNRFRITVSVSNFVPKPFTPFQWVAQDSEELLREKHDYLRNGLRLKQVQFNYHDTETSLLEAIFARGDRRLSNLLIQAHKNGAKMDGWSEYFCGECWKLALTQTETNREFYATRERSPEETMPWDIIDCGVRKDFLWTEWERALEERITEDCRIRCDGCGIKTIANCEQEGING